MAVEVVRVIDPDMGSGYDYDSLTDWEAGEQGDLTGVRDEIAVAKCRCTNGTADAAAVVLDGWTTSSTQYIKIWTDPAESYRPTGKWETGNKYRLSTSGGSALISVRENYTQIIGIYISTNSIGSGATAVNLYDSVCGGTLVKDCYFYATNAGTTASAINHGGVAEVAPNKVINCVFRGPWTEGFYVRGFDATSYSLAYNCTAYGCAVGFRARNSYCRAKNCLAIGCTDAYLETNAFEVCEYNGYDEGTDPGTNGIDLSGYTDAQIFVDAANGDFHLAAGSPAIGVGTNLYADSNYAFQTDIDGQDRGGAAASWDIGADEYIAIGVALPRRAFDGPFYGSLRGSVQ